MVSWPPTHQHVIDGSFLSDSQSGTYAVFVFSLIGMSYRIEFMLNYVQKRQKKHIMLRATLVCEKGWIYSMPEWNLLFVVLKMSTFDVKCKQIQNPTDTGFQLCLLVCEHTEAHLQHGVKEHSRKVQMLWIDMYRFICPTFFLLTGGRVIKGWKTLKQWVIYL